MIIGVQMYSLGDLKVYVRQRSCKQSLSFWLLCSAVLLIPWMLTTVSSSDDFKVFYQAAQVLMNGENPYDLKRFGFLVYKYPPWCLPLFIPFAVFPFIVAKWIWALLNVALVLDLLRRLLVKYAQPSTFWVAPVLVILFYPLGMVNALMGQVSLILVWGWWSLRWIAPNLIVSSSKIMTLLIAVFFIPRKKVIQAIVSTGVWVTILVLIYEWFLFTQPLQLLEQWRLAASSGQELGLLTLGRDNQGLPAFVLRLLGVSDQSGTPHFLLYLSLGFALPSIYLWRRMSAFLSEDVTRAGWLLLCAAFQPMAWFHTFLFGIPAVSLSIIHAIHQKRSRLLVCTIMSCIGMTMMTKKTLGPVGAFLEILSIKSWAALAIVYFLVRSFSSLDPLQSSALEKKKSSVL